MEMKAAVWAMALGWLMVMASSSSGGRGGDLETVSQEVLATDGKPVVFGPNHTYSIWALALGSQVVARYKFIFGLGGQGDPVWTETNVTLGRDGNASEIYACSDGGEMVLVPVSSSGTPANALMQVKYYSDFSAYKLLFPAAGTYVDLSADYYDGIVYLNSCGSSEGFGSLIRFISDSSFSSYQLENVQALRQVVNR